MTVTVKVNRDCYLTVIDVGAGNKAVMLFPNIYAPNNAVKAGASFTIPDPSAGFEFEVTPPGRHRGSSAPSPRRSLRWI